MDCCLLFLYRGWEKLYVVLTTDSLLFYKDQKHAKAVSDLFQIFDNRNNKFVIINLYSAQSLVCNALKRLSLIHI